MMGYPLIAITMGEPAGIGAEVIVRALTHKRVYQQCVPVVIGDSAPLEDAIRFCDLPVSLHSITDVTKAERKFGQIEYIGLGKIKENEWSYKENSALGGEASYQYVTEAIRLANDKRIAAIVTAPLSKESLHMAGYKYNGHTEILADQTGTKDFAMLLASKNIHVIHVSTHVSLREACDRAKKGRILKCIRLADIGMKQLGYDNPRIAVAGLNPHCSENGLFGTEEKEEIIPAIEAAREEGYNVTGPVPPDTVFVRCQSGEFDIVVAMYHDQGHIPLKLSGFQYDLQNNRYKSVNGINCTIGLPIIRTSVDHGTAFGKAGEGRANEESMLDAIDAAIRMVRYRSVKEE